MPFIESLALALPDGASYRSDVELKGVLSPCCCLGPQCLRQKTQGSITLLLLLIICMFVSSVFHNCCRCNEAAVQSLWLRYSKVQFARVVAELSRRLILKWKKSLARPIGKVAITCGDSPSRWVMWSPWSICLMRNVSVHTSLYPSLSRRYARNHSRAAPHFKSWKLSKPR